VYKSVSGPGSTTAVWPKAGLIRYLCPSLALIWGTNSGLLRIFRTRLPHRQRGDARDCLPGETPIRNRDLLGGEQGSIVFMDDYTPWVVGKSADDNTEFIQQRVVPRIEQWEKDKHMPVAAWNMPRIRQITPCQRILRQSGAQRKQRNEALLHQTLWDKQESIRRFCP
jgi:hypothetical protein